MGGAINIENEPLVSLCHERLTKGCSLQVGLFRLAPP